jgi:hypothetical protein
MTQHALRLSMALALGTSLAGVAFAQGTTAPGATTPPQVQQPSTGMPSTGMPSTGMQAPAAPNTGSATSNYAAPNPGAPNPAAPSDEQSNNVTPDTVKQAQQQLKDQGLYNGAIDGQVGPATRAAIQRFQRRNGLKTTAMLDQETLQRLMSNHHG